MPQSRDPVTELENLLREAGFDLRQVTWGYQEIFREALVDLVRDGLLGRGTGPVSDTVFAVLNRADKSTFDSVLKGFLEALSGPHRWLMRLPRLFERWATTGILLAEQRHFLGIQFFDRSGHGDLGTTPAGLELSLDLIAEIREREPELVGAFLQGCSHLRTQLGAAALRVFVHDALRLARQNPRTARGYLSCRLASAQARIRELGCQVRLAESGKDFERLLRGLCGRDLSLGSLAQLDSDDLQERGTLVVACPAGVYLPETVSLEQDRSANLALVKGLVAVTAMCFECRSFPTVHGTVGVRTCRSVLGDRADAAVVGLFQVIELARVLWVCRRQLPGLMPVLRRLVGHDWSYRPPLTAIERLAAACVGAVLDLELGLDRGPQGVERVLDRAGRGDDDWQASREWAWELHDCTDLEPGIGELRALSFFPDFLFPVTISPPQGGTVQVDLRDTRPPGPDRDSANDERGTDEQAQQSTDPNRSRDGEGTKDQARTGDLPSARVGYFYDEWNSHCGDYYRDWCCVRELPPRPALLHTGVSDDVLRYAAQVRRVFERLRPEEMNVQTRLYEGDEINLDHLLESVVEHRAGRVPDLRVYRKPLVRKRDVAVTVLLDLSGSTADPIHERSRSVPAGEVGPADGARTVMDVEKETAYVLAAGLSVLGDRFSVGGFTGTGRENCIYCRFKGFDDPWDREAVRGLLGSAPGSSTRIGAALRHAGWRLGTEPARTRLLLLMTDGKPCDQGYDTESHYAHHDVRKACEENRALGIHTFCVSTSENTPADMELMFPGGRYVILEDISRLPSVLARVYLRLTR